MLYQLCVNVCIQVMVMDQGQVAEYDTPKALLSNPNSLFFALVQNWEAAQAE